MRISLSFDQNRRAAYESYSIMNTEEAFARELLNHAKGYRDASRRLVDGKPFLFHPTFYCAIHSVELAIKAHLAVAGVSKKRLSARELGHNLAALLKEAEKLKIADTLQLDCHDRHNISLGSRDYSGKCFEYPELLYSTFPIGVWLQWADNVIDGFSEYGDKPNKP